MEFSGILIGLDDLLSHNCWIQMVSITVYDGTNGIGGNKIYVNENGRGISLDFGRNFGKYRMFLKNRETRGIHDLIHLELIPGLNIYRPDIATRMSI